MSKLIDLTGQRFGKLTVIEMVGMRRDRRATWKCQCDCGRETTVCGKELRNGDTKSCGCLQKETARKRMEKENTTHGYSKRNKVSRLYRIWGGMKERCNTPSATGYEIYGGRGIKVCPEWRDSFEAFQDWALANGYRDDLTIERNDTDGDYCPENCRWATQKEQQNNRSNNRLLTHNGKTMTITQWAEATGLHRPTITRRLKRGLTVEESLRKERRKSHGSNNPRKP